VPGAITLDQTQFALDLAVAGTALAYLPETSVRPLIGQGPLPDPERMGLDGSGLLHLLSRTATAAYRTAASDRPHPGVAAARSVTSGLMSKAHRLIAEMMADTCYP
jgi:DNA-binding transcriptional LysR family regulator